MIRVAPASLRHIVLAAGVAVLASGCGLEATVTNGVSSTVNSISDATSSTTKTVTPDGSKSAFVNYRLDAIAFDAARGGGENLDTLASLLGETDRAEFGRWTRSNYARLFIGLQTPDELLSRIEQYRHQG